MTEAHDKALALLSTGYTIKIKYLIDHMGPYAALMMNSMRDLTKRNIAVYKDGGYQLKGVNS